MGSIIILKLLKVHVELPGSKVASAQDDKSILKIGTYTNLDTELDLLICVHEYETEIIDVLYCHSNYNTDVVKYIAGFFSRKLTPH